MTEKLNKLLADLNVLWHKLHNYHWHVAGQNFFQAHAKLEELYDQVGEQVDAVAEVILMSENKPLVKMADYLKVSTIKEVGNDYVGFLSVVEELKNDFEIVLNLCKELKKENDGKCVNTDVLLDELIAAYTKHLWMFRQTLIQPK